jgi:thiol-disulfide isomerase/thioredoxin
MILQTCAEGDLDLVFAPTMTPRAKTAVRAVVFASVCVIGTALLARPFRPQPTRRIAPPMSEEVPPEPPRGHEFVTLEGLVAIDSRGLFERMKKSTAKGIVVGAWANWCGSCKVDLPILVGLRKTFPGTIDVMLVSVDEPDDRPKAAKMLAEFGETQTAYVVDEDLAVFKPAMHPHWPGMLPATFLFDPAAKVHYFWGGPVAEDELVPLLKRYLAGENVDGEADFALIKGRARGE